MSFGPISVFGVFLLGLALLWSIRLAYGKRRNTIDDSLRLVLTIAGWSLIHIGLFSVVAQLFFGVPDVSLGLAPWLMSAGLLSIVCMAVMLTIFGMAVARYRALEWTALMWLISAAAERGIPLWRAVRCFALERSDEVGIRAARLADLLERGVSLPDALGISKTRLPLDGLLAARYGSETGDMGGAIAGLSRRSDEVDALVRSSVEKGFYLGILLWLVVLQLTFMAINIIPIYSRMFDEFQMTLPPLTVLLTRLSVSVPGMGVLILAMLLVFLLFFLLAFLFYLGWLPRDVPVLNRLTLRYDGALVMRAMAVGVRQQRPVNRIVWILARMYPKRSVRGRLRRAGERINRGEDWCDSLARCRLFSRSDAAVFKAAARVGNLEWALEEMADSSLRRLAYRLRLWINLAFPSVLLLIGLFVAVVVIGLFQPIVELIRGLI